MNFDEKIDFKERSWDVWSSVIFQKTSEEWGGFSNMCAGFRIDVNGKTWLTSEALYQALRFPDDPELQEIIRTERSPMAAKMKTKPFRVSRSRKDWDSVRVDAMWWCLIAKLISNEESFGSLLKKSGKSDVVERSHRDRFWGAVRVTEDYLQGQNVLGVLLTMLRDRYSKGGIEEISKILPPKHSRLFGVDSFSISKVGESRKSIQLTLDDFL